MTALKKEFIFSYNYIKALFKWVLIAVVTGLIGGVTGSIFHLIIDYVTQLRAKNGYLLYFLPIGGIIIAALYRVFKNKGKIDTDRVLNSVQSDEKVPFVMMPLIFVSTVITHLFGGSAGREGAALQLGGSIGYNLGKLLHLNKNDIRIIVMAGMSSVFAALFGTPVTAAIFALEVVNVGIVHYAAIVPCVVASITAYIISMLFGLSGVRFHGIAIESLSPVLLVRVLVLSVLCAALSIVFCVTIKKCEVIMHKLFKNRYVRAFTGGLLIVGLTLLIHTRDYNGAGMDVVARAISGEAKAEAFLLKMIFTAITIAAGFKGGEIVPTFFVGATFGCVMGSLLGLNPSLAAAIGFVTLFCGVVNCPLASIILSIEVFGAEGLLLFVLACSVSYMMSGCFGLYKSQRIIYSKIDDEYIDINTR